MESGHLKELADTVVKIADKYKDSPAATRGELTSILTHNGSIFKLCDRCRKALDDPNVQEALRKG